MFKAIPRDQNWVQLAAIQSSSLGLPAIILGIQLTKFHGAGAAIGSIIVGNLILWLIAIGITSMAFEGRLNAIENVKNYLGKSGSLFMWLILMFAFLDWYVLQLNVAVPSIGSYFSVVDRSILVRIGAGFGLLIALLAIGGIQFIKQLCVVSLFPLFFYSIFSILRAGFLFPSFNTLGVTVSGIISTIFVELPGIINLPTFFRHARSRTDCYLALTVITLLYSFFEIATIWMNFTPSAIFIYEGSKSSPFAIATLGFVALTLICINIVNIYFASACWESLQPHFEGGKGYAIIGLLGTAAYVFIQIYAPIRLLEDLANSYIASLGVVLLIAFLVRIVVRHRPRPFEKRINGFCWFIGCLVATLLTFSMEKNLDLTSVLIGTAPQTSIFPLLMGMTASAACFLFIIFLEENIWAIRQLTHDRAS